MSKLLDNFHIKEGFLLEVETPKFKQTTKQKIFTATSYITSGFLELSKDEEYSKFLLENISEEETAKYADAINVLKGIVKKLPDLKQERELDENGNQVFFKTVFKLNKRLTSDEIDEIYDFTKLGIEKVLGDKRYRKLTNDIFNYFSEIIIDDVVYDTESIFGINEKYRIISMFKIFFDAQVQNLKKK